MSFKLHGCPAIAALGLLALSRLTFAAEGTVPLPENFSVAAVGDVIYQRPSMRILQRTSPTVLKALREADVTFGNFESTGFALQGFHGAPQSKLEGPTLLTPPAGMAELKSMGFDLVSHANNHVFDWGAAGVLATNAALRQAGLSYAGSGVSLRAAREPAYFTTQGVRVALVAATSSFPPVSMAADGFGALAARPGVNGLNLRRTVLVSPSDLEALRSVAAHEPPGSVPLPPPAAGEARLLGQTFKADARITNRMGFTYQVDDPDRQALLAAIVAAKAASQMVLYSLHVHEPGNDPDSPPDFAVTLAHEVIDAGADAVLAHGAHRLRAIEIYKGKPIFYSLANFSVMLPSPEVNVEAFKIPPGSLFTSREFSESVVAVSQYRDGKLAAIRLHPFALSSTHQLDTHGLPQPVSTESARQIVERLQILSRPFGTAIAFEDGVGVIRVGSE